MAGCSWILCAKASFARFDMLTASIGLGTSLCNSFLVSVGGFGEVG